LLIYFQIFYLEFWLSEGFEKSVFEIFKEFPKIFKEIQKKFKEFPKIFKDFWKKFKDIPKKL